MAKELKPLTTKLQLPEEIVQHIQSFLSGKEAASTAVLSKAWYDSWLTRPNLDFDERDFQNQNAEPHICDNFFNFVKRSMERYHELNIKIDSFKLWMTVRDIDSSSRATELIVKAVKMVVIDLNLEIHPLISAKGISVYLLPKEVFEAGFLIRLSLFGCKIDGNLDGKKMCSRLKSLSLRKVCIGDDMLRDIIFGCPLIENLFMCDCQGLVEVNVSKIDKLKKFAITSRQTTRPMVIMQPLIQYEEQSGTSFIRAQINMSEFRELSCLVLEGVKIDGLLFQDFSTKFPCVEDLTVRFCNGCIRFDISSHSLKYISLAHREKLTVQFDVPNIRKFKYSGSIIPSLSLATASREWESDITFSCWSYVGVSWFLELKKFLTQLSLSKISLSIELFMGKCIDSVLGIQDFPRPIVENLTLKVHSFAFVCSAFMDGIFWSLRPKLITQRFFAIPEGGIKLKLSKKNNELLELLCKKLMDLKICNSTEKMIGWHELEEVNAEIFECTLKEWRPLPWKTLSDALVSPEQEVQIRFRLRWGSPNHV